MKKCILILLSFVIIFCELADRSYAKSRAWPENLPIYDHIVIVVEENKNYDEIIGSKAAPYINDTLKADGANLTQMYAEEHMSQGNYFWLFSGSNQNVGFYDIIPDRNNNANYPFTARNLGEQLIDKGLSFKGYAEGLPAIGDTLKSHRSYARKHVPWISFSNVPNGKTVDTSSNLRFADFPSDYKKLPTVCFVIPDLDHDMHNGRPPRNIEAGDTWLRENLDRYYRWARTNNSLLILTFDENSDTTHYHGLTDPASSDSVIRNRIVTIIGGAHIKPGNYPEGKGVTHVNVLRTLEAMYGLAACGAQQPSAVKAGIADAHIITDIFKSSTE
jgi:phosphatidylinositol-3-phosphatase